MNIRKLVNFENSNFHPANFRGRAGTPMQPRRGGGHPHQSTGGVK